MNKQYGYHYTSIENWAKIRAEGLKPYAITRKALNVYLNSETVWGIWTWQYRQTGLSHIGSILYQMGTKATKHVVLLTYEYDEDDLLTPENEPDRLITLPHDGYIENLQYHSGKEEETAVILLKTVPADKIDLLDTFNLLEAWKK